MIPADFHFLRPHWLYALVPAVVLVLAAWRRLGIGRDDWAGLVDRHLLRHLAVRGPAGVGRWPALALLLAWILTVVAMAGPAWQKIPTPALDRLDPVVVVLSLARSMDGTDARPSRLTAARHKVEDLLARMRGGQVGLVIYADAPFVATPLTEDGRVVGQMLGELSTDLMPVPGDRPDLALAQAAALLRNTGARTGRILLVADGLGQQPKLTQAAAGAAAAEGYVVSVLDVVPGGSDGARAALSALAATGRGNFARISPDGSDLDAVLAHAASVANANPIQESTLQADQWMDMGSWLLVAVIPLAALAFRRGWLALVPLALVIGAAGTAQPVQAQAMMPTRPAPASPWRDLWRTPDQQGAQAFRDQDYATAAERFQNPAWKGSALYEGGTYGAAAQAFAAVPGADYNRGNALARAGRLEEAVSAYDTALARDPSDADANHNREIVKRILALRTAQNPPPRDQNSSGGGQQPQSKPQDSGGGADQKPQDKQNDKKSQDGKTQDKPQQQKTDPQGQDKQPSQKDKPSQDKPDKDKPGQDQQAQDKPQPDKSDQNKQGQDKQAQDKPDKPKQDQNTPSPGQPSEKKPETAQNPPSVPPQPQQPQSPPPQVAPQGAQAMSEQDQNREQALRSVPDDPVGLLRARIRSYYTGTAVPAFKDRRP